MLLRGSILLSTLIISCNCSSSLPLPVFLIDYDNVMSHLVLVPNPFFKVSTEFFNEIVTDAIKRSVCVIIFVEEQLCTEDVSMKDSIGTPFYHLQKGIQDRKVLYMPYVSDPYTLLKEMLAPQEFNSFKLGSGLKLKLISNYTYLHIFFEDNSEISRIGNLRKHDIIMKEVYFTVRQLKPGPIIGFYTGKRNPVTAQSLEYVPKKPKPEEVVPDKAVIVKTKDALFRLSGMSATTQSRRSSLDNVPMVDEEVRTRRTLSTTMQYTDFQLQFNFDLGDKDWKLANVALLEAGEEVGKITMGVGAPWDWSYYCAEPITIINQRDGSSVTVTEYQIQPLRQCDAGNKTRRTNDEKCDSFGSAKKCGPYFNPAIISCLMITFILLVILFWGIIMLFNCETNSKFDDPNAKTIQVVQER